MKTKKILALLLAVLLITLSFSACSSSSSDDSSTDSSSTSTDDTSSDSEAADDVEVEIPVSDVLYGEIDQQTYPIVDETITLSLWYPMAGSMGELADFNDAEFFQWYEEKTNIHIDFIIPASGTETESFQLLFVSDNMPDMLYTQPDSQYYRGGEDQALSDGYFVNMVDYLDVAPNYVSWMNSDEDFGRAVYSDEGNMYGMWGVWDSMNDVPYADQGISIRQDFLDAVGLEVPTTYDEWETVLIAFRDELGIEAPLYTSMYGIDYGEFMAGYDTAPYFYQRDGVIEYGPLDDQYKEYLELLNHWWEEGLLDTDFATRTTTGVAADSDMILNDKVGALVDWGTRMSDTYITRGATNEDFYAVACPQPVQEDSDIVPQWRVLTGTDLMNSYCMLFSADGDYIEEAIRWNDGFYAEEVYLNANYGLEDQEDVVWYADEEDGHRIGDYDFRYYNPDGLSSATVLVQYWTKNPPVRVEAAQIEQADENKQASYDVWSIYDANYYIPTRVTMTSDEQSSYAALYTDIETYVQECNIKFIMGQMSLDDYDSYRETLISMGIEECMEIYQAALDRYNAR